MIMHVNIYHRVVKQIAISFIIILIKQLYGMGQVGGGETCLKRPDII